MAKQATKKKFTNMNDTYQKPIAVLGAGSWGGALALYLSRREQRVQLWTIETDHIAEMQAERTNRRYLPGHPFPSSLQLFADLKEAVSGIDDILIAVPSVGFRDTLNRLKPLLTPTSRILWVTKGLDQKTGELLHQIADDVLKNQYPIAALSGPSFALEVAAGLPTAVVIASHNAAFATDLVARFNSPIFRTYLSTDLTGVEVGGVVKNVLAIATGISDGMGFGTNARCALITRGLAEMTRLGVALGAQKDTFVGLAGLGDLVLTCTDNQSRNRRFGLALGKGKHPTEAEREIGQVVEGKLNAESLLQLAKKHHVSMPITETVAELITGKLTAQAAMENLLAREPTTES